MDKLRPLRREARWVFVALQGDDCFDFLLLAAAPAACAEKRFALLIGNQGYASEMGRLPNPRNDVALLERTLNGLGFEVAVEWDVARSSQYAKGAERSKSGHR